ncbi:AAA family ATPase [Actinoplanes sp. TBRC 11911]|uniref:AAA family ATPase n=1 Tax=Actinoplanes sp. TBRC 11911 TaxID=2729386 RepID=UPI00145E44B5|nr:LuxR family transcriptional regulator [Actinoplanes sp. TBRC 11911]NMO56949.1 AAA family ATPase [Actinoplanes sp. TBRC 11911]
MASSVPGEGLRGRRGECQVLDRLVDQILAGQSRVLVLRGEAGIGKSALLEYTGRRAEGCRVVRAAGVESEMELAFAGLHQLCVPMLDNLEKLPEPQRDALKTIFGLSVGAAPDRFLVGLAVLSLFAEAAEQQPLICLIDDAQWLDRASAQTLAFVARRMLAEPVGLIFAARTAAGTPPRTARTTAGTPPRTARTAAGTPPRTARTAGTPPTAASTGAEFALPPDKSEKSEKDPLGDIPEILIRGLGDADARTVLASALHGAIDSAVRDRIVAESRGNPLALLELPRTWTSAELAGGFGLPETTELANRIEQSYLHRLGELPPESQLVLLTAAAEPVGDVTLLWRALERLGIGPENASAAEAAGLIELGAQVRFRHPLVRSAVYGAASPDTRRQVHRALAEVTDPQLDPDRRAWHLAHATTGLDEDVATELELSAGRARARGGLAAAAAFLDRSASLTADPAKRAARMMAAAQHNVQAGTFDAAMGLLTAAESGDLDEFGLARVDLLRGQVASASTDGRDAPALLLKAARRLEPHDPALARETYFDAWGAALFAGDLATSSDLMEVSWAVRSTTNDTDPLLGGLAVLITEGRVPAAPLLRKAVRDFRGETDKGLQWAVMASAAAVTLWDFDSWDSIVVRQVDLARAAGALAQLSIALNGLGLVVAWTGDQDAAAAVVAEAATVTEATGTRIAPYGAMLLAALRGRDDRIESAISEAAAGGEGLGVQFGHFAAAMLLNGLGRYDDALLEAERAAAEAPQLFVSTWALPELIEAAVRAGNGDVARAALAKLVVNGQDTDWSRGIVARCRALLADGGEADEQYREAIDRLGRTRLRPELARAHLLYGEWLRRKNRRGQARQSLRTAYEMFTAMGAEGFADRAGHELSATGETVRKRRGSTRASLTPQEELIARLARDGQTNPEIGAELFISARTVEWHLRKIFSKLGVSSRRQLRTALAAQTAAPL